MPRAEAVAKRCWRRAITCAALAQLIDRASISSFHHDGALVLLLRIATLGAGPCALRRRMNSDRHENRSGRRTCCISATGPHQNCCQMGDL